MGSLCVKRDKEPQFVPVMEPKPFAHWLIELERGVPPEQRPFLKRTRVIEERKFQLHVFGDETQGEKAKLFETAAQVIKFQEEIEPVEAQGIRQEMARLQKIRSQCETVVQHLMGDVSTQRKKAMILKFSQMISRGQEGSPVKTNTVQTPDIETDLHDFDITSPAKMRNSQFLKYVEYDRRKCNPAALFYFIASIVHTTLENITHFNERKITEVFKTLVFDIVILQHFKKIPYEDKIDMVFALYEQRALELEQEGKFPFNSTLEYKFIATNLHLNSNLMSSEQFELLDQVIQFVGKVIEKGQYHYVYAYSNIGKLSDQEYSEFQLRKEMYYILKTGQYKILPFYKRDVSVITRGKYRTLLRDDLTKGQLIFSIMLNLWTLRQNFYSSELQEEDTKKESNEWDWFEQTFHVGREIGQLIVNNSQFMKKFCDIELWNSHSLVDIVYIQAVKEVKRTMKRRSTMGVDLVGKREQEEDLMNYSMTISTEDFIQKRQSAMALFGGGID